MVDLNLNPSVTSLEDRIHSRSTSLLEESPLATQEYFVNMGPQHPSTHGVLRLVLKLDGETVKEVIPVLGYIHRSIEKKGENVGYRQQVHLTDRLDYLCAIMNNWVVAATVEKAAGIETNDRIQTLRTIMAELQRLQSHLLWWGVFGMDLGAFTPFLHGFRDRERITKIFEDTIGARLTMNYVQPGGLMYDIHPDFIRDVKALLSYLKPMFHEYDELFSNNIIVQERLRNVGKMDSAIAISMGTSGPVLRASGVAHDLRKTKPYGAYGKVDFSVPIGSVGDCWDRYMVRMLEMRESVKIIEQLLENIPEGKTLTMKPGAKIRPPAGVYYEQMETARGIFGCMIQSDGSDKPSRVYFRTPNFHNLWCLTRIAPGGRIADLVAIISSLDIVVPDIDR